MTLQDLKSGRGGQFDNEHSGNPEGLRNRASLRAEALLEDLTEKLIERAPAG